MSAFPFGSSFDGDHAVLQQMRGRRSRERKPARATDPARRHAMIEEAAYYRAERRGFAPGHELEDWLQAEAEAALTPSTSSTTQPSTPITAELGVAPPHSRAADRSRRRTSARSK